MLCSALCLLMAASVPPPAASSVQYSREVHVTQGATAADQSPGLAPAWRVTTVEGETDQRAESKRMEQIGHAAELAMNGHTADALDGSLETIIDAYAPVVANASRVYSPRSALAARIYRSSNSVSDSSERPMLVGPALAEAHWARGFALSDQGAMDAAREALQRAVALAPLSSQFTSELAFTYARKKDWSPALRLYRRAAALAILSPPAGYMRHKCVALRGMGYVLTETDHPAKAARTYVRCLKLNPSDRNSMRELRYIMRQLDKQGRSLDDVLGD